MDRYQARLHEHTEPQRNATRLPEYIKRLLVGGLSGTIGGVGDMMNLISSTYKQLPMAGTGPIRRAGKVMGTDEVGGLLKADTSDPAFIVGSIGAPDASDLGKIGGLLGISQWDKKIFPVDLKKSEENMRRMGYTSWDERPLFHASNKDFEKFMGSKEHAGLTFVTKDPKFASEWAPEKYKKVTEYHVLTEGNDYKYLADEDSFIRHEINYELQKIFEKNPSAKKWFERWDSSDPQENTWRVKPDAPVVYQKLLGMLHHNAYKRYTQKDNVIYPVVAKTNKLFDPRKDWEVVDKWMKVHRPKNWAEGNHKVGNWQLYENEEVVEYLKSKGYDSMLLAENYRQTYASHDTIALFDPSQIRGRFAKFDPKKAGSAGILAGTTALGIGAMHEDD